MQFIYILHKDSWVLMLGGYANKRGFPNATLFNWLSREQCQLPDLPYDVSGLSLTPAFGVPIFCGGSIPGAGKNRKTCYKLNMST
jgi:hypothetical protein